MRFVIAVSLAAGLLVAEVAGAAVLAGDRLTPLGTFSTWPGVDLNDFVFSPDGLFVYPTTGQSVFGPSSATVLARDPATGLISTALTFDRGGFPGASDSVAISPDGAHVYFGEGSGTIGVFERDAGTGDLTFVELEPAQLGVGDALVVAPDGAHVYSARDSFVSAYERDAGTGALTYVATYEDGVGGFDGLVEIRDLAISPDGEHLYVASWGADAVAVLDRDVGTGALTFVEVETDGIGGVDGLEFASGVAVSPDGAHVYVVSGSDGLAAFARDAGTGALTFLEVQKDGIGGVEGLDGSDHKYNRATVAVAPDGLRVYASVPGDDLPPKEGALTVFRRAPGTGLLTFIEAHFADETFDVPVLAATLRVRASPDGGHVYVGAQGVTTFGIFRPIAVACPAIPAGGCREAVTTRASKVVLKTKGFPGSEKLLFKWLKGAATDVADFGDPVGGATDYALCVYDGSVEVQPRLEATMPGGGLCAGRPCWKTAGGRVKYVNRDRLRQPDGIVTAKLLAGAAGRAKIIVRGKREALPFPALPLTTPVVVQVHGANGFCATATFSGPKRNDASTFAGKSD